MLSNSTKYYDIYFLPILFQELKHKILDKTFFSNSCVIFHICLKKLKRVSQNKKQVFRKGRQEYLKRIREIEKECFNVKSASVNILEYISKQDT